MRVKFCNIGNVEGFMNVIDSCNGKVDVITENGDILNLKSKLSQYVAIIKILGVSAIREIEVIAHEKEDVDKLLRAMVNGTCK